MDPPAVWLMDGTTVLSSAAVGSNPGPTGRSGTGDFNGDGKSDILWQHDNGTAAIWTMDGTDVLSIGAAGSVQPRGGLAPHRLARGATDGDRASSGV